MQTHVAETRLQRNWFRIVSSVFPIVAPNPSQSIDPWKWNEVDFSLHLSWSVFCSSIQAPFVSRFIDSCWRCEHHCCRWKCRRRQNHRRHQRHLRSQSSQRHRRDLWGREDREGVGPLWLWHAWYLLQEHVLRSGGFQMIVGRLHRLVFVVSCAVLWVPKCQKRTWNISLKGHMAETRLQRKQCRIVSSIFPIVAPDPSQSIDPWKWIEVDFSLHLSWSVFCSSSIQAPFVSRFIDSCWRCERHCCRHQRHLRSLRSQSSQRHRRDLWGREDREGVGPLWLWHAWYLLQEHVLRSGGFQMTRGRFHCLVLCCFLCSPLGAQVPKRVPDIWVRSNANSCGWDKTAKKLIQDRFFCLPYCCPKFIPIHRSMKMEWSGFLPPSFMVCLLLFINSGTLRFPFHWLLALWAPLLQVEVPEAPKPPKAPKAPEVPELPKAPQGPMGQGR